MILFEPEPEPPKIHFRLVGMVTSPEFQLCRCYIERIWKAFQKEYAKPDIKPMLDVEWNLFIKQTKRTMGGEKLWALQKPLAVFINGEFLGHDEDLLKFISARYKLTIVKDFEQIGTEGLAQRISKQTEMGNYFVYFSIAIDGTFIGSLLFQIFAEIVPEISRIFMTRVSKKRGGYDGTPIQRIVIPSWIQCGGWNLKHYKVPCENYKIPHDRRGILSMCHNGKHKDNSTQFFITLDPTPWMDTKYVAFGKLVQGDEVLKVIEKVPTYHEAPLKSIKIVKCGKFDLYPSLTKTSMTELEAFLANKDPDTKLHKDVIDPRDAASVMLETRYKRGLYSSATDLQTNLPFLHLPDFLLAHFEKYCEAETEGGECDCDLSTDSTTTTGKDTALQSNDKIRDNTIISTVIDLMTLKKSRGFRGIDAPN